MKRYKAELWDKTQHIMERYNDHTIRCSMKFENTLDFDILKKTIIILCDKFPILKSHFYYNFFKAEWRENEDFYINDILLFKEKNGNSKNNANEEFLIQKIDEKNESQIKILLFRENGRDTLNIIINHMVMDGADTKIVLNFIAKCYNDLIKGGKGNIPIKNGTRSEEQLFRDFNIEDEKKARKLLSYSKNSKDKLYFPYEKTNDNNKKSYLEKLVISEGIFDKLKKRCKEKGFTLNDMFVACYIRAIYDLIQIGEDQTLGIPCMVDMRRYLKNGQTDGLTNLTSMITCNLGKDIGENIFETTQKVKKEIDIMKNDYPGLYGLPLLRFGINFFPYVIANILIGKFFKNPLFGISNIGIMKKEMLDFGGISPKNFFMTGSIKYNPYLQLSLSTYENVITFVIAFKGSKKDRENIRKLMKYLNENLIAFTK